MRLSDLDEVIEAMERIVAIGDPRINPEGEGHDAELWAGEIAAKALDRLREMRANAVEGWVGRSDMDHYQSDFIEDESVEVFRVPSEHFNESPALLITSPRGEP